mgnify:CR=1 FL=1
MDELPAVQAHPDRVAQVLRNLLINALRHTFQRRHDAVAQLFYIAHAHLSAFGLARRATRTIAANRRTRA